MFVSFVLCSVLILAASVNAACPPLVPSRSEPTFLEQLAKQTPTDGKGADQNLLNLLRAGKIKLPTWVVFPPNGPAPLTVDVRWWLLTDGNPYETEIDMEGSGAFVIKDSRFDPNSAMQEGKLKHTYERSGTFQPTLRVRDDKGNSRTYLQRIVVKSKAQFETELKTTWADFKTALRQRDLAAALDCTHASAREKYTTILPEVLKSSTPIDQILTDIEFVDFMPGRAEFRMLRKERNSLISYTVVFLIDEDGIWRIKFF